MITFLVPLRWTTLRAVLESAPLAGLTQTVSYVKTEFTLRRASRLFRTDLRADCY